MLLIITIVLTAITVVLAGYALYLRIKIATGKGRFATSLASSILLAIPTTIFAVGQLNFSDSVISIIRSFSGSTPLDGSWALASKALDYFLITILCIYCIRTLYRFGQSALDSWDGPPTALDVQLLSAGEYPDLFVVAREYATMKVSGKSDVVVDARALDPSIELSDTPPNPQWESFCRDLVLEAFNEVSVPETHWSSDLNCWFGTFAPLDRPTVVSPVAVLPLDAAITPREALRKLGNRAADISILFACVATDDVMDQQNTVSGIKVRTVSRSTLLSLGVNLRGYCEDLITRFEKDSILGSDLKLSSIYVEPVLTSEYHQDSVDFTDLIHRWSLSDSREQLSLVGEFGQGKSSAILKYCASWARAYLQDPSMPQRIPLLIPLRGRDPSTLTRQNFLASWGVQYRLSGRALLNLVVAGRAILFFEGFDEVNNAGLRSQRISQFDALWRFAFPKSKLAFTGRPNFFLDDKEMRRLLRIDDMVAASGQPFASLYSFRFFSRDKIIEALRPFDGGTIAQIVGHFDADPAFRDVASRPSMLPLIAITWNEIKQSLEENSKVTSAKIIENYVEFEYRRKEKDVEEDQKNSGLTKRQNYLRVPHRIKTYYMMCLARDMQRSGRSNTITSEEMAKSIRGAQQFAESFSAHNDASDEEVNYFKWNRDQEKELGESKAAEALISDIRTTGVVSRDIASGPSSYYFPHKQFYEYFLAMFSFWSVKQKLADEKKGPYWSYFSMSNPCSPLTAEPQAKKFFVEIAEISWWDKVFTVNNFTTARVLAILMGAVVVWVRINLKIIQPNKILMAVDNVKMPKLPDFLMTIVIPAIVITALIMLLIHFTVIVALVLLACIAIVVLSLPLAISGNSVVGLLQWYDLVKTRFADKGLYKAHKVLGPLAYSAVKSIDDYATEQRQEARERALRRALNPAAASADEG